MNKLFFLWSDYSVDGHSCPKMQHNSLMSLNKTVDSGVKTPMADQKTHNLNLFSIFCMLFVFFFVIGSSL